jgi:hypothetical protein
LLLPKIITTITLGTDKIQRQTLKPAFNCTQQLQKSHEAQPARCVWSLALGKKGHLFIYFSSPNKQKPEHQSESNSATSWTPSPWKASLCCTTLKKAATFSLPAGSKVACVKLQKNG